MPFSRNLVPLIVLFLSSFVAASRAQAAPDHFQCYEIHRPPVNIPVSLIDRHGPATGLAIKAKRICNPANKNGEDPTAPSHPDHLVGYPLKYQSPRFFKIRNQVVVNQFGTFVVDLIRPDYLFVPTHKSLTGPPPPVTDPGVDHFKCYKVRAKLRVPALDIEDQFTDQTLDIKKPIRLCLAAEKNGEGIVDPNAALMCYQIRPSTGFAVFRGIGPVFTHNQFGPDIFDAFRPTELCVPSETPAVCGNGIIEAGEECERPLTPSCSATCQRVPVCGDGFVDTPETCDPPTAPQPPNGNLCGTGCTYCGDGVPNGTEQCDDGNTNDGDGCRNDCTVASPTCGNGTLDPGETCDPPGTDPPPAGGNLCRTSCTYCGDGTPNGTEQCDDGNTTDGDGCRNDCTVAPPTCGNGTLDPGETCDPPGSDPPPAGGNLCRTGCTYCGDGVPNGTEQCDDGNTTDGDACRNDCTVTPPTCGNGTLDPGETCDPPGSDPPPTGGNLCRAGCTYCGDGVPNGTEQCDDGNTTDGDACRNDCTVTPPTCGNGTLDPGETCDPPGSDPPPTGGNLCRAGCTYCGDGVPNGTEQCDDGNTTDGDACRNDCTTAPCSLDVAKTCCLPPPPSAQAFACSDAKPIDALSLIWNGSQPVRIKAYKGAVGSTLLADIDGIQVGEEITVAGFAGSPNDVYLQLFAAGTSTLLGTSTFHLSCSDDDMDGPEDCGKTAGDGKGVGGQINQWIFEGLAGNGVQLNCTPPDTNESTCVQDAGPFTCSDAKPIDSLTMIWNGTEPIKINAYKGAVGGTLLATIDDIATGEEITVPGFAGAPNDVYFELFRAGTNTALGTSTFHLSCSDADMNGPEDCGKAAGDGKAKPGQINQWIFDGMSGSGQVLDCTPTPPAPTDRCEIPLPAGPHCTTKVMALGLRYLGGGCVLSNPQNGAASCTGVDPGSGPVSIVVTKDASIVTATPSSGIDAGDVTTLQKNIGSELSKDTKFDVIAAGGAKQSLSIRTSCSKPLNLGDRFGAMQVVSIDRKDEGVVTLGGTVEYTYTITNPGGTAVANVTVEDDKLGPIGSPIPTIGPGETVVLRTRSFVAEDTVNTVTVTSANQMCGEDIATVTVPNP